MGALVRSYLSRFVVVTGNEKRRAFIGTRRFDYLALLLASRFS